MYTETDFHIKRAVSYEIYTLHVRRYAVVYSRLMWLHGCWRPKIDMATKFSNNNALQCQLSS